MSPLECFRKKLSRKSKVQPTSFCGRAERRLNENLQKKNGQNGSGWRHPLPLLKSKILLDPFKITSRLMLGVTSNQLVIGECENIKDAKNTAVGKNAILDSSGRNVPIHPPDLT